MTKKETAAIMAIIYEAYHFFYNGSDDQKAATAINLWSVMFREESYEEVEAAVYMHIATEEKPPTVAHIKKALAKLKDPGGMSEIEAANMILRAAANSTYNAAEEFNKLPPVLQRLVVHPGQLREWGLMDAKTVQSVVASNLMRSYKVVQAREKEMAALPESVKAYIGFEQLKLEG